MIIWEEIVFHESLTIYPAFVKAALAYGTAVFTPYPARLQLESDCTIRKNSLRCGRLFLAMRAFILSPDGGWLRRLVRRQNRHVSRHLNLLNLAINVSNSKYHSCSACGRDDNHTICVCLFLNL